MGMFDNLKCEYTLPDSVVQNDLFQTKSLERMLGNYTITFDGRLKLDDEEIEYHGDITFYTSVGTDENGDYEWFEYQARFTNGKIQWIKRISK